MLIMFVRVIIFVLFGLISSSSSSSFQTLFPEQNRLYTFSIKTNVTTGTLAPIEDGTFWVIEGTLSIQVYDEFSRARLQLDNLKTLVQGKDSSSTDQTTEAVKYLSTPWEVGICFTSIHVDDEPLWITNIKRALSFNLLVAEPKGSLSNIEEPCLYGNCMSVYSRIGMRIRKYSSSWSRRQRVSTYEQRCNPSRPAEWRRPPVRNDNPNYLITAERVYNLDEVIGLKKLQLKNDFQYRTRDHILKVTTELLLAAEYSSPVQSIQKLNLTESPIQYTFHNYSNPSNGIWNHTQQELKNTTYQMLLKIARQGIDADNIVRNASLIHSLDFIELLNSMSQLYYDSLAELFEDVLGTSYELETSRNIFLEVLPYVRNDAGARLIKHLVVDQKAKIEDAMLVSLIRKLPYNILNYDRSLLQELEILSKLGQDFPQEIRHAGILSFATLVNKAMETSFDQQYFDDIYDKYLRMYNYCPQYLDRLVWLQGLTNIGKNGVNYLDEIYTDTKKDRHERLWAALASLSIWKGANPENTLPILMNETEHIQLRILALHTILSSPLGARDFFNVHNYVKDSDNAQLKRFWYTTIRSLKNNKYYNRYESVSRYIPFFAAQLPNPGLKDWATNNYIISQEPTFDQQGPTLQVLTVGGAWSGLPELVMVEFSTGGELAYNGAIYIVAEGVTSNIFKRFQTFNASENFTEELVNILKDLKVEIVDHEKVHIDIVVKVYDKTIYATHIDQTRFDGWNTENLRKSTEEFVRFGSHINQQMVYYPTQMVKDFPTEIGTPVRLLSTIVSFTSLRGNLTAPSTEDLTWRNDLHIRYQGTAVTALSTDGPLHPSAHTVRIQQSMVIHLPIKFDVRLPPVERALELKWTNPVQSGGIAMHSRTQIETSSRSGKEIYTVTTRNKRQKEHGVFFDCENPMTKSEISQHLTSRNYNFLRTMQPTHVVLNMIRLITSPTVGSCGLILPPHQLQTGNKVDMEMKVDDAQWDDGINFKASFGMNYYRETEDGPNENYFSINGYTKLLSDGRTGDIRAALSTYTDPDRNVTVCFSNHHKVLSKVEIDFTDDPAAYEGDISVNASLGSQDCEIVEEKVAELNIVYDNEPIGVNKRQFAVKVGGKNLPFLVLDDSRVFGNPDFVNFWNILTDNSSPTFNTEAVIKEENDEITATINGGEDLYYKTSSFSWLPPSWTTVQMMKQLGFYYECRVQSSGVLEEQLLIGECTNTPRFAVILSGNKNGHGNVTIMADGSTLSYHWPVMNKDFDQLQKTNSNLKMTRLGDAYVIRSKPPGLSVYFQPNDADLVIHVPQPYMYTACGICINKRY
ncbi:uncharacterized protein LOC126378811 [Pectinophora gossypiella]|uniref:uncharacterized protein LOC126378811 n=1 Tax=Pectinophora gossypiella TaxID=13191 RepID=UPI00214EA8E3|nr:uncharacterized protein LOC126378811 [Pectinophora gossypiella]